MNATLEETLWPGAYVTAFPHSLATGYLYPAAGFALWHLAPLAVRPNPMPGGAWSFVGASLLAGLRYD